MKIDKRKFPNIYSNPKPMTIDFDKVYFLSNSVIKAVDSDVGVASSLLKHKNEIIPGTYRFLFKSITGDAYVDISFHINQDLKNCKICVFNNSIRLKTNTLLACSGDILKINENGTLEIYIYEIQCSPFFEKFPAKQIGEALHDCISLSVQFLVFIQFARIEINKIKKGCKFKDFNCYYENQTDIDIITVDSEWWDGVSREEGFNVRGHFRMQPYGKNLENKRLIWINEFEKQGYHRKPKRDLK